MNKKQQILQLKEDKKRLEQKAAEHEEVLQDKSQKLAKMLREAEVEKALERVRSVTHAMKQSNELTDAATIILSELQELGIPVYQCYFAIFDEENRKANVYGSVSGDIYDRSFSVPIDENPLLFDIYEMWKIGDEYFQADLEGDKLNTFFHYLYEETRLKDIPEERKQTNYELEQLILYGAAFSHGTITVLTKEPFDAEKEKLQVLQRFAHAFDQTYRRYLDIQRLDIKNQELEQTLDELQAAQKQLVQQEKLASLGQLTAGIAHEIKNPLNFVNNFSDVSVEMIEEAKEELSAISPQLSAASKKKSPLEGGGSDPSADGKESGNVRATDVKSANGQPKEQILAILNDIEANLRKIHEHGSRADGIVKSMLQHSRGGSGEMEPTDLNMLVEEYVNLAFHGMRAGKNPINVDIDLQLDENVGKVPLVGEDFSRVIVNVCNNAFDAMAEKANGKSETADGYHPKLFVCTARKKDKVTIEIEDNGPGISDELKGQILQPFFTTKKGTEGTGLGLSISNDIVKAHGGEIDIESKTGETTKFIIHLKVDPN